MYTSVPVKVTRLFSLRLRLLLLRNFSLSFFSFCKLRLVLILRVVYIGLQQRRWALTNVARQLGKAACRLCAGRYCLGYVVLELCELEPSIMEGRTLKG